MICIIDFGFVADCVFSQNRQKLSDESLQSQSGRQHTNTHTIVKCNWQNTWSTVGLRLKMWWKKVFQIVTNDYGGPLMYSFFAPIRWLFALKCNYKVDTVAGNQRIWSKLAFCRHDNHFNRTLSNSLRMRNWWR